MDPTRKNRVEGLPEGLHIHTTTEIRGVTMPTWFAALFILSFALSLGLIGGASVYLAWQVEDLREDVQINTIYIRDIGAILIREGVADPRDFQVNPLLGERQGGRVEDSEPHNNREE